MADRYVIGDGLDLPDPLAAELGLFLMRKIENRA
jgi:hypothetical protein